MFILPQWLWFAVALIAVTIAASYHKLTWVWVSLAATITGSIVWFDHSIPNLLQIMFFALVTLAFTALAQFFYRPSQTQPEEEQTTVKAPNPRNVVNKTFTLTEPIVNGFGQIEIDGVVWRVRGEDMPAGGRILVRGVDGLERDLLIVVEAE